MDPSHVSPTITTTTIITAEGQEGGIPSIEAAARDGIIRLY